jgi:hypothetical protein
MARRRPLTSDERDYLARLLDHFGPRLEGWLTDVSKESPAEALRLYAQFAEFVRPKLARVEKTVTKRPASRKELLVRARELGLDADALFKP